MKFWWINGKDLIVSDKGGAEYLACMAENYNAI